MFDTIRGLPLHPLTVHAVVVLLPLGAVLTALVAARPALRRHSLHLIGYNALVAAATFAAIQSGEALERRVRQFSDPPGLSDHQQWGKVLFLLSVALLAGAVIIHFLRDRPGLMRVVAALAVLGGLAVLALSVVVGESGASMVWRDVVANTQAGGGG